MVEIIVGILAVILVVMFFAALIGIVLMSTGFALFAGLFISVFVGIYTVAKNCVVSIKDNVSNKFVKITLFIAVGVGIAVLCLIPFLPY